MSDKNQERIATLEEYERETSEAARRAQEANDGEFDKGMRDLARICGLPETSEGMREYMRRKKLRMMFFRVGACVFLVGAAVAAWLIARLLT